MRGTHKQEILHASHKITYTANLFDNYSWNVEYNLAATKSMPKPQ